MKNSEKSVIVIDPDMSRYDGVSLFPEKMALAKEMLAKTNLKKLHELIAQHKQVPK